MNSNKSRIAAIIGTIIIHALIFLLSYTYSVDNAHITLLTNEEWPPRDSSEILFGGEYVMAGDVIELAEITTEASPANTPYEENSIEAEDLTDAGNQGTPTMPTTSTNPSTMQVPSSQNDNINPGATNEVTEQNQDKKPQAQQAPQMSQSAQDRINNMNNRFNGNKKGSDTKDAGKGSQGSQSGDAQKGNITGNIGASHSFGNRQIKWALPKGGTIEGDVVIDIVVAPNGKVISAKKNARTNSEIATYDSKKVSECIQKAKECKFSEVPLSTGNQKGTITFKFRHK